MPLSNRKTITVLICFLLNACSGGDNDKIPSTSDRPSSASPGSFNSLVPATPTEAGGGNRKASAPPSTPEAGTLPSSTSVTSPPSELGLAPYYQKYLDAGGIPIVAAMEVEDGALHALKRIVDTTLSKRKDVRDALVAGASRFMIIPRDKGITSLPEYAYLQTTPPPDGFSNWDARARGMGGLHTSCGEENLLRLASDPYQGQSICIHEFAHTILSSGLAAAEPAFRTQLQAHYDRVREEAFVMNTYMATSVDEYWATVVQAWYDAGLCRNVPDGVYGPLCDHASLGQLDPGGYELVNRVFNPPPTAGID